MRFRTVILFVAAVILCGFLAWSFLASVEPRFSFSVPLCGGDQKIETELPPGRYALVISTNSGSKTFGAIPPKRDYTAQIGLEVRATQGVVLRETNAHYLSFSLSKEPVINKGSNSHLAGWFDSIVPFTVEPVPF